MQKIYKGGRKKTVRRKYNQKGGFFGIFSNLFTNREEKQQTEMPLKSDTIVQVNTPDMRSIDEKLQSIGGQIGGKRTRRKVPKCK